MSKSSRSGQSQIITLCACWIKTPLSLNYVQEGNNYVCMHEKIIAKYAQIDIDVFGLDMPWCAVNVLINTNVFVKFGDIDMLTISGSDFRVLINSVTISVIFADNHPNQLLNCLKYIQYNISKLVVVYWVRSKNVLTQRGCQQA